MMRDERSVCFAHLFLLSCSPRGENTKNASIMRRTIAIMHCGIVISHCEITIVQCIITVSRRYLLPFSNGRHIIPRIQGENLNKI